MTEFKVGDLVRLKHDTRYGGHKAGETFIVDKVGSTYLEGAFGTKQDGGVYFRDIELAAHTKPGTDTVVPIHENRQFTVKSNASELIILMDNPFNVGSFMQTIINKENFDKLDDLITVLEYHKKLVLDNHYDNKEE